MSQQVYRALGRILRATNENYQVQIAAATVLLNDPTSDLLKTVRDFFNTSQMSRDLRQFLVSWIRTIAKSQTPYLQEL